MAGHIQGWHRAAGVWDLWAWYHGLPVPLPLLGHTDTRWPSAAGQPALAQGSTYPLLTLWWRDDVCAFREASSLTHMPPVSAILSPLTAPPCVPVWEPRKLPGAGAPPAAPSKQSPGHRAGRSEGCKEELEAPEDSWVLREAKCLPPAASALSIWAVRAGD